MSRYARQHPEQFERVVTSPTNEVYDNGDEPDDCPDHGPHKQDYCPGCKAAERERDE